MESRTARQEEAIREGVWVSRVLMGVVLGVLGTVLSLSESKSVEGEVRESGVVVARGMGYFEGGVVCLKEGEIRELGLRVDDALVGVLERDEARGQRSVGRALGRMDSGEWMGGERCKGVLKAWRDVSGVVR